MNYLYIDANIYLKFYLGNKLFKVLETLVDNRDNIIVTEQIADEVIRNAVTVNIANLNNTVSNLQWTKPSLPYKNTSAETLKQIEAVYAQFKSVKTQIESDLDTHLNLISTQKDEITLKLKQIFEVALKPNEDEQKKATILKKYGNPPGKKSDPIGDELSWVQLLNRIQPKDKLIIVTNDRDYASIFNKKSFLNSKLHSDLEQKDVEYYVYSEILEGLNKLKDLQASSEAAFEAKELPTNEEQEEIKQEELKIIIDNSAETCKHQTITIRPNGVFDDYFCNDCHKIVFRQYSDDLD